MKCKKNWIVSVVWEDAGVVAHYDEGSKHKPFIMKSVGIVLSHNDDRLILSTVCLGAKRWIFLSQHLSSTLTLALLELIATRKRLTRTW